MSSQSFSNEERFAIWEAHGKKCFYDKEPLNFKDMEIDHVVPESLLDLSKQDRENALALLQLPAGFDIRGYGNLVPCHGNCNRGKSDHIGDAIWIGFVLSQIKPRLAKISEILEKGIATRALDTILRHVSAQLMKGTFNQMELAQGLTRIGISFDGLTHSATVVRKHTSTYHLPEGSRSPNVAWPVKIRFFTRFVSPDAINIQGVSHLLEQIAAGRLSGEKTMGVDGNYSYVVRSDGLYIKYRFNDDELLILSCHLSV